MKAVIVLVILAIAAVNAASIADLKAMVSMRSSTEFQACHGNTAALDATLEDVFGLNDRVDMIHSFIHTPDAVLLKLGASRESINEFRKVTAEWKFPTWDEVKAKVSQAGADAAKWITEAVNKKIDAVKDAWNTAKAIAKDIWTGNWCGLCGKTTTLLGNYIVGKLEISVPTLKDLVCKVAEYAFDKACTAAFTAIVGGATVALTLGGATVLSGKIADGICWVLDKLNAVACDKLYGQKIADAIKSKIPQKYQDVANKVYDAVDAINALVKAQIMAFTGETGYICKDALGVCKADGKEAL